jgi:hypothetical protein
MTDVERQILLGLSTLSVPILERSEHLAVSGSRESAEGRRQSKGTQPSTSLRSAQAAKLSQVLRLTDGVIHFGR